MPKQIDFFDGAQSSTVPTIGDIDTTSLIPYADDATYEAANAGSPTEGNIYANTTDSVIRYYNGSAWITISDQASDVEYDNASSGLTATDAQGAIDEIEGRVDTNETDISTNQTDIANLETLSGVSGATDNGTFTGTTIPDSSTTKAALQALETEVEDKISSSEKASANGVATLDGSGKVPSSQLTISAFEYLGTWDADTNTPTLADGVGNTGDTYRVTVAGTQDLGSGNITYAIGDRVVYNPSGDWEKWGGAGVGDLWGDAVDANIVPDTDDTYDIGSSANRFQQIYTRNLESKGSNTTSTGAISSTNSNGDAFCRIQGGFSTPTGVAQSAAFHSLNDLPGDLAVYSNSNSTADANATADVAIETGNKTAGTGNSGNIKMTTGTSAGGSQGEFKFIKSGDSVTTGHVWTASASDGTGYWAASTGSGPLALDNDTYLTGRNSGDTADLDIVKVDTSNLIQFGNGSDIRVTGDFEPVSDGTYSSASSALRWASCHADNFEGPGLNIQLQTIPSGTGSVASLGSGSVIDAGIFTGNNANADAVATRRVFIQTGNKSSASATGNTGNIELKTGNAAGTSGDSGDVVIDTGTSANGSQGNLLIKGPSLSGASASDVLTLQNSVTGEAAWAAPPSGGNLNVASYSSATTANISDDIIQLSGASFTLTLPTAIGASGKEFQIIHQGTSLTQVYTLDGNGAETIRGNTTFLMHTNGQRLKIYSDGTNWQVLEHYTDTGWIDDGSITIGAITTAPTKGTTSEDRLLWRRNGADAEFRLEYVQTAGGSDGTDDYLFTLPTNISADTSLIGTYTTTEGVGTFNLNNRCGDITGFDSSQGNYEGAVVLYDSSNVRFFTDYSQNNTSRKMAVSGPGIGGLATTEITYVANFKLPIDGWEH